MKLQNTPPPEPPIVITGRNLYVSLQLSLHKKEEKKEDTP